MIFNTVLSVAILNESFTRWDCLAISLIIVGGVGCMMYTKTSQGTRSNQELMDTYTSLGSVVYFGLSLTYILSVYLLDKHIRVRVFNGWRNLVAKYDILKV